MRPRSKARSLILLTLLGLGGLAVVGATGVGTVLLLTPQRELLHLVQDPFAVATELMGGPAEAARQEAIAEDPGLAPAPELPFVAEEEPVAAAAEPAPPIPAPTPHPQPAASSPAPFSSPPSKAPSGGGAKPASSGPTGIAGLPPGGSKGGAASKPKGGAASSSGCNVDGVTRVSSTRFILSKKFRDTYIKDSDRAQKMGSGSWHEDSHGKTDGAKVANLKCAAKEAGLRNGDVVEVVNGKEITGMMSAWSAYGSIKNDDAFDIVLSRGGSTMRIHYTVQ